MTKLCAVCRLGIPRHKHKDAIYCSRACLGVAARKRKPKPWTAAAHIAHVERTIEALGRLINHPQELARRK